MATPKGDNSKGQRKAAVAKKADPGSRGRKTTPIKGSKNARVTPKIVESGVGNIPSTVVRAAMTISNFVAKSSKPVAKESARRASNNSAAAKATGKSKKMTDYATGRTVKNPTSNTRPTLGGGRASAIPESQKNAAVQRAYAKEGRHPTTGKKLKYTPYKNKDGK